MEPMSRSLDAPLCVAVLNAILSLYSGSACGVLRRALCIGPWTVHSQPLFIAAS